MAISVKKKLVTIYFQELKYLMFQQMAKEQNRKTAELVRDAMDEYLEKVSSLLPEGMTLEEDKVTWTEPLDNRNLTCIVQLTPPGEKLRTKWISHKLMVDEPEDDWEW